MKRNALYSQAKASSKNYSKLSLVKHLKKERKVYFFSFLSIASAVATAAIIMAATHVFASSPDFSKPQPFPAGIYIQPSQASKYAPTPMPKGTGFYIEFANVPDYASFAKISAIDSVYYDTKYGDFYYLDTINQVYSYSSKVYDYFNVNRERLSEYKAYLVRLGFEQPEGLAQVLSPDNYDEYETFSDNPQYINLIKEDILYDPDFTMDLNGVYSIDTEYGYTVVVFGDSRNYHGGQNPEPCTEIRLYNLFCDYDVMGNIMKYAENFKLNERIFYYYAPERQAYIPFTAEAINSYIQEVGSVASDDNIGDYMSRLLQYIGGAEYNG